MEPAALPTLPFSPAALLSAARAVALGLSALAYGAALSYEGAWASLLAFGCLIGALWAVQGAATLRGAFACAWIFWLAVTLGLFWADWGPASAQPARTGLLALALLGLYPALKAGVLVIGARLSHAQAPWLGALAFGAAWVGLDAALAALHLGLPDHLYLSQSGNPGLMMMGGWLGAPALSFGIAAINVGLFSALSGPRARWPHLAVWGAGALALGGVAFWSGPAPQAPAPTSSLVARLVQPDVSWEDGVAAGRDEGRSAAVLARLFRLGREEAGRPAAVTLWPEQVCARNHLADADFLQGFKAEGRTPLLFGTLSNENGRIGNSAALISPEYGEVSALRHKRWLVPLYETSRYVPGDDFGPIRLEPDGGRLGVMICYESVFEEPARRMALGGAQVLITLANDSFFGHSRWPQLHARETAFRAVENARWAVHLNNSGASRVFDAQGRTRLALPTTGPAARTVTLSLHEKTTPFQRGGWLFSWACLAWGAFQSGAWGARRLTREWRRRRTGPLSPGAPEIG